jgi:hypothetical protein
MILKFIPRRMEGIFRKKAGMKITTKNYVIVSSYYAHLEIINGLIDFLKPYYAVQSRLLRNTVMLMMSINFI